MKKKLNGLVALLLLAGSVAFTGCFKDNTITYDGPLQVEFKPTSRSVKLGSGTTELPIQLIGPQQNQPIQVRFSVVVSLTTAQQGVHYTFGTEGNTVTINANDSFARIPVNVLQASAGGQLVVQLEGSEAPEVVPAINYRRFTLTLTP